MSRTLTRPGVLAVRAPARAKPRDRSGLVAHAILLAAFQFRFAEKRVTD